MAASAFSTFTGAEYVDQDRRHLLFISESLELDGNRSVTNDVQRCC